MRKTTTIGILLISLGISGISSAAALCSSGGSSGTGTILSGDLTQGGSLTSTFSCSIGAFTFSNFTVFGTVINEPTGINPFTLTETSTGLTIDFGYPNLSANNDDIGLAFQITPGVLGETLTAGPGTTVTELICDSPTTAGGGCPGTVLSQNGNWTATNGGSSFSLVTANGTDYVFKDVRGGSSLSQTIVPEPMTFSLMGVGLLGMGLLSRKLRRRR